MGKTITRVDNKEVLLIERTFYGIIKIYIFVRYSDAKIIVRTTDNRGKEIGIIEIDNQ